MNVNVPTIGVEEEYQLIDPQTGRLTAECKAVMRHLQKNDLDDKTDSDIHHELHLNQIEMASDVCTTLDEVRQTLQDTRRVLGQAALASGCRIGAAGTNPFAPPAEDSITPKDRYESMENRYQQIARELFIFGCHVHVAMEDRELGMRVMNRCRRWLPLLQAISCNSPFWDSNDTGYASYRRELWAQWPMAGAPPHFDTVNDYQTCVDQLTRCGAIKDESFIYWDIRLPTKVPTIEFRGADVMTRVEDTVGYAGLVRAMVISATRQEHAGQSFEKVHPNVLAFANWHAARYGMTADLVDPATSEKLPAYDLLDRCLSELNEALEATGEREPVDNFVASLRSDGPGAEVQRKSYRESGDLKRVVREVADTTWAPDTVGSVS